MVGDGVASSPARSAPSPGMGGQVPAEARADDSFLGHQTETLEPFIHARRAGLRKSAKIYDFLRQHGLQWSAMVRLSDPPAIIEFGHFSILPHRRQLFVEGRPIRLGGRAFDLLLALIEAPGAVVGKNELVSRIWPGRIVEENRLQSEISGLRKAFGADPDLIQTVAGRGYQFAGEIREPGAGRQSSPRLPSAPTACRCLSKN